MWLLSPFTAFQHDDEINEVPQTPAGETREGIESALRAEVLQLADEFRGIFSAESIDRLARECLEIVSVTGARYYLAQLAGRFTRERLKALARAEGLSAD